MPETRDCQLLYILTSGNLSFFSLVYVSWVTVRVCLAIFEVSIFFVLWSSVAAGVL